MVKSPRIILSERAKDCWMLILILLMAAGLKATLLLLERIPFNSDEAVVALMARHILDGERPVFFYGQAYMGSLDAWLVALGFTLFGQQVWVIRLVQILLYLLTIISTVWIGKEFLGSLKIGLGAGVLLAVPTVNVTLYTTASLGGYGEALLIGNLILISGLKILHVRPDEIKKRKSFVWWPVFGLLAGLGLWANGLTLIYTIPVGVMILVRLIRNRELKASFSRIALAIGGFFLGSGAWWWFALDQGIGSLIQELFGSAVAVEGGSWLVRVGNHLVNLLLLGSTATLGLRPPWSTAWLGLPLVPFVLLIWGIVFIQWRRLQSDQENPARLTYWLLAGMCITLAAGFVLTSFGVDPSGRYFVPLAVPLSLAASAVFHRYMDKRRIWGWLAFAVLLGFHLWGTIQSALKFPPGITTQFYAPAQVDHRRMDDLIEFLKSEGITRGYSNYWVTYPLAFLSEEELIFIPRLPYHPDLRYTARDDRYPPYRQLVTASGEVAYITTRNPALDEVIAKGLGTAGVTWQEIWIGDYHLFYHLSRPVRPAELGLEGTDF